MVWSIKITIYIQGKINGKDVEAESRCDHNSKTATADGKLEDLRGLLNWMPPNQKALADKGPLGTLDKALSKSTLQRSQLGAFRTVCSPPLIT